MKQLIKTFLLTLFMGMLGIKALAYDAYIDGIYYILSGGEAKVTYLSNRNNENKNAYNGSVVIPETITYKGTTYSVTGITGSAFQYCSGLTDITIPISIVSIGERAFYGCSGLKSFTISDLAIWCNITFGNEYSNPLAYAQHLYINGDDIKDLVIPNSVSSIANYAFSHWGGLKSVSIPNSVTSIGDYAFNGCSNLTNVSFPNSLTNIGNYAFNECSSLTNVSFPNSVTNIGDYAFYKCSSLTSLNIPVANVGRYSFSNCSGLTSVFFANSVTKIGNSAFGHCSNLTRVNISSYMMGIGSSAFYGCSSLTNVEVSIYDYTNFCNNVVVGHIKNSIDLPVVLVDLNGNEIKEYSIPNDVTRIGNDAFSNCSNLTNVTIPNSVTSIGDGAFSGCI